MTQKKNIPRLNGKLRANSLMLPECIWKASGIVVLGRRIKSVIFTIDIAIIRNCNADAVLAVYPFTPQQVISQTLVNASSIPVFSGVGGGLTTGLRSVLIARDAEANGAFGVVVNAATKNDTISLIHKAVDIPVVVTVVNDTTDIAARLDAGASILNISAAADTPRVVADIKRNFPNVPVIATGGPTDESIEATIRAGANTISYTPPSAAKIFASIMSDYRKKGTGGDDSKEETDDELLNALKYLL